MPVIKGIAFHLIGERSWVSCSILTLIPFTGIRVCGLGWLFQSVVRLSASPSESFVIFRQSKSVGEILTGATKVRWGGPLD